jgi:Domain of unknown function (DUF4367)
MNEMEFENKLRAITNGMEYPRTPDIAGSVRTRLHASTRSRFLSRPLAWSLAIILVLISSLMLIPSARAAVLEFIQIGVDRIFPRAITPTIQVITTATPEIISTRPAISSPTPDTLIPALQEMAGETTLADAQKTVTFPILLPAYPSDLGPPDYVFVQNAKGNMAILVWLDPQKPNQVLMSLHQIPKGSWMIDKFQPKVIQETSVKGQRAIWTEGPYPILLRNGDLTFKRLVTGHVLIWTDGNVTYRLESDLSLEEAVKIAESLRPVP